jgi:hypothetical protein
MRSYSFIQFSICCLILILYEPRISILAIFRESQETSFLRNHFDDRINTLYISMIIKQTFCQNLRVYNIIQNIKLLHIHIHEQYFLEHYKNLPAYCSFRKMYGSLTFDEAIKSKLLVLKHTNNEIV